MPSTLVTGATLVSSLFYLVNAQADVFYCKDGGCTDCPIYVTPLNTPYCAINNNLDLFAEK
jgi:hypothetical protein